MIKQTDDLSSKLAFDVKGLGELRQGAKANSPDALKGAAKQFEAMFINMMMKSMRDTVPQDGPMDSEQTKTFTSMLDQQMSQKLATRGIGLANVLVKQLSQQAANTQALALGADPAAAAQPGGGFGLTTGLAPGQTPGLPLSMSKALLPAGLGAQDGAAPVGQSALGAGASKKAPHIRAFQDKLGAAADAASAASGIPAKFMLGQAALETGWGKHEIKNHDGTPSHNLFGIKAGPGWTGKVATAVTTEYVNGTPQTRVEKFRAYDSYADSFKDYANTLASNKRYDKVLAKAGDASSFAHGLQRAGYATDPFYASKLSRIINHSLG